MDLQLKERLVGAIVLVVASVIIIPWVLDGPNRDTRTTQSIDLPPSRSVENDQATKTFRLSLSDDSTSPAATDEPSRGTESMTGAVRDDTPVDGTATATGSGAATVDSGWTVQVGSFTKADNARSLVSTLKGQGFEAYVNELDAGGSHQYRVRIGQFDSRDDADALAIRVRGETGEPARPVKLGN